MSTQPGHKHQVGGYNRATFYALLSCNARCPFCSTRVYTDDGIVAASDHAKGQLRALDEHTFDFDTACAELVRLRDQGIDALSIQGGEPTLFPRLDELIEFGTRIGFRELLIVTNGRRLADPDVARRLHGSGLDTIALSIFGSTAALHDESLGSPGAFEDMVRAVENLVQLGSPARGPSLTGQLLLHAKNFHDLPEMVRFWYDKGIRLLSIRLLRETANTGDGEEWFFDLERLRPHLGEALDVAMGLDELRISLGEVFFCLLDATHLYFLLDAMESRRELQDDKLGVSKQRLLVINYSESHRPKSADPRLDACTDCEARYGCMRIEDQYLPRFSGDLVPVHLQPRLETLASDLADARTVKRLAPLLREPELLTHASVSRELAGRLLRRVGVQLAGRDPEAFSRAVLAEWTRDELARFARRLPDMPIVRLVPLREVSSVELECGGLAGRVSTVLEQLGVGSAGSSKPTLRFLQGADPIGADPFVVLVGGELRPPRSPTVPYVVAIYDDQCLEAEPLGQLLARLLQAARD